MRIEPYGINSIVHIVKRGTRGMNIIKDDEDRWRFVRSLFLLNDEYQDTNWHRDSSTLPIFKRPLHWPEQKPLVRMLGWTLMSNHFHLLLQEIQPGGIAKFMQRLGGSMSLCFNAKYTGEGSIFQGAYKARTINRDLYLRYVMFYILAKNVLDLYPGGLQKVIRDFDPAWSWALQYPFSSLRVCASNERSSLVDSEVLSELGLRWSSGAFKKEAKEMILLHMQSQDDTFKALLLEKW